MTSRVTSWTARLGLLAAVGALIAGFSPSAFAQGGQSTPGVTVTAINPGTAPGSSSMRIALTAHTELSTVPYPSCRPEDMTLECWGSLVLQVPSFGELSITGFQLHRVAVGDISCGDEDEGDCSGTMTTAASKPVVGSESVPVEAQVNGTAYLADPGDSQLPPGTEVQVKITLTDNGPGLYRDQADVQINQFEPGPDKPLIYDTGLQTIEQVAIHWIPAG